MMTRIRLTAGLSRGLLVAATGGLLAGVAACGSTATGSGSHPATSGSPASATAPLCANAAHLDRVVVTLRPGLPGSRVHQLQPGGVTVTDPARVRAVASALCGLPRMPHGVVNCPLDTGGGYRLFFSAGGRTFPPVMVEATGCRSVTGLGPVRTASGSFWTTLHKELGVRSSPPATAVPTAS
jgi:hypothetical protein